MSTNHDDCPTEPNTERSEIEARPSVVNSARAVAIASEATYETDAARRAAFAAAAGSYETEAIEMLLLGNYVLAADLLDHAVQYTKLLGSDDFVPALFFAVTQRLLIDESAACLEWAFGELDVRLIERLEYFRSEDRAAGFEILIGMLKAKIDARRRRS